MHSEVRPERVNWWDWLSQPEDDRRQLEARLLPHLVRVFRALMQVSQAELAVRANISRKTVNSLESGQRQPDERTCKQIKSAMIESKISVDIIDERLIISIPISSLGKDLLEGVAHTLPNDYEKSIDYMAAKLKLLAKSKTAS
jgi:DNA-binding XRE family transcriptional regulator